MPAAGFHFPLKAMVASLLDAGQSVVDIGRLTPWQVRHLCCHPRDKNGQVKVEYTQSQETFEEQFRGLWRGRGLPEYRIQRKWREHLKRTERA